MKKFYPLTYLAGLNVDVLRLGLDAIGELLSRLGNPQDYFPSILIAGTNGKGSTAAMTASILSQGGFKTGLYTSPHLEDVRERIAVNGRMIAQKELDGLIVELKEKTIQPLTYFEFLTAASFLYFQRQKVDIAVLEVGLGGRLDATNICRPLVSLITNIAHDHMNYLGKTISAIAREKAGIIKQNGICLTAASQKKVQEYFAFECLKQNSKYYRLGYDFKIRRQKNGLAAYAGLNTTINDLTIPLPGMHQLANAALALAAVEQIAPFGFSVNADAVRRGLEKTGWPARLEILQQKPLFIVDGAHNPAGMEVLCHALRHDFSYRRLILIFGALADKDYGKMLRKIAPLAHRLIITGLNTRRALPPETLCGYAAKLGYKPQLVENVKKAIERALQLAGEEDLICAAGSLYLAGQVKQAFPSAASCDKKK